MTGLELIPLIGLGFCGSLVVYSLVFSRRARLMRAMRKAATTRIADAKEGAIVKIVACCGRASPH